MRSLSPQRPSDVVAEFEPGGAAGVQEAIARARNSLAAWNSTTAIQRGRALTAIADAIEAEAEELSSLVVREIGKPIGEARSEVARAVAIFRYYAQVLLLPDGETYPGPDEEAWLLSRRYPMGVCALITPWNFPVAIPSWKIAPALCYANTVVLKPAPAATATARALAGIIEPHIRPGVLSVVAGDAETGGPLVEAPGIDAISFTGSKTVGRLVASQAASRGVEAQCEMGGQNASIVLADADLDAAAQVVAAAAMGYAGQKCTATSRVIVEARAYEPFIERLVDAIEALPILGPEEDACRVGPVISDEARQNALSAIADSGGRILTGGSAIDGEGFFMAPTLVEIEDHTAHLAQEEIFAPVAATIRVADAEQAIEIANAVEYGLVAAVFTNRLDVALGMLGRIRAGLVRVNAPTSGVDFHAPFGGASGSGLGPKEQGLAARDFYTQGRTMLVNPG